MNEQFADDDLREAGLPIDAQTLFAGIPGNFLILRFADTGRLAVVAGNARMKALCADLGVAWEDLRNSFIAKMYPDDISLVERTIRVVTPGNRRTVEFRVNTGESVRWIQLHVAETVVEEQSFYFAWVYDVTDFKEKERQYGEKFQHLSAAVESVPGGIATMEFVGEFSAKFDGKVVTTFFNDALAKMVGYSSSEYRRMFMQDFQPLVQPDDLPRLQQEISVAVKTFSRLSISLRLLRKNGGVCWGRLDAVGVAYDDREGRAVFQVSLADVTKEKLLEEERQVAMAQLQHRLDYDSLTGLLNRTAFARLTTKMLKENPGTRYVLIRWNIERFKLVNDLFGTSEGNAVLRSIAGLLESRMSGFGTYGRLEADHFVLCLPKMMYDAGLIRDWLDNGFENELSLVFDAGIYEIEDSDVAVDQMCDRANMALQTVKGKVMRRYALYDDKLRGAMLSEQEILNEMNSALLDRQFVIYYQPVHSLSQGKTISAEALVRWKHPVKGMIPPGMFIPLFERNGFIAKLDYYIWESVCAYLKRRADQGLEPMPVSVNMSRFSFYTPNLCNDILGLVHKYNVPPELLRLEVTESVYTDNPQRMLAMVETLRRNGFMILMDDFGSGYSSLNMLKDMPVDILKLDMVFLRGLNSSPRAACILEAVVNMAKGLGLPTVSEGVETVEQVELLRKIGCDRIQGYYFSRPLAEEEFEKYVAEKQ